MTAGDVARSQENWQGRLWLLADRRMMVFIGSGSTSSTHRHHAVQLVVALEGHIVLTLGDRERRVRSVLIPRDCEHAVEIAGPAMVIWIDPHSAAGHALDSWADDLDGEELDLVLGPLEADAPDIDVIGLVDLLLAKLDLVPADPRPVSRHVQMALDYLDAELTNAPTLRGAADRAAISPSRLTHCFTREVGIPFRRYVLWLRLLRAVECVVEGSDLTRAATHAGFSDSAHLSRTFRSTFGLTPSALWILEIAHPTRSNRVPPGTSPLSPDTWENP